MEDEMPKANFNQVLCACADGFGALSMSVLVGYTSIALILMKNDPRFELNDEQVSWIGAIVPGMALVGSLVSGKLLEKFGRRRTSLMISLPAVIAWMCVANAANAYQVVAARLISGFCLGVHQVSVSVFVSETVHPKLRPKFSVIPGLSAMAGFFIISLSGAVMEWREMAWLGCASCLPLFILFQFILPETPYYLLKNNKSKESLKALKWLRPTEKIAETEFKELQQTVSSEKEKSATSLLELTKPPYRWSFSVALLLHFFQQLTGISALTSFMSLVFDKANSPIDPVLFPTIMIVINIVIVVIMGKVLGKYPRKVFTKISSQIIIVSLLVLAGYFYLIESQGLLEDLSNSVLVYIPPIAFITYVLGFSIGWGPLPWMFIGESLPLKIRGTGAGLVIATNWAFNFLTTKTFMWSMNTYGGYSMFLFYTFSTIIGMKVMDLYIPETSGFTANQLDKFYEDSYKIKKN